MERLLRGLTMGLGPQRDTTDNVSHPDTGETVNISSLALLKMLRHARSGVPLEVMGLMLGSFIDDYTINVVDVFAMPQSGTSVTVESVDPVYQTKHLELLKQTGRHEMVVGWYHSHPGFGCWLSSVDVNTQQSFEALHARAVAVVVDPVQSVKGKVILDAFRSINPLTLNPRQMAPTGESRQCTSNLGHLVKPNLVATVHGLGTRYYSLNVNYKMSGMEQNMLVSLHRKQWSDCVEVPSFGRRCKENLQALESMVKLADAFAKDVGERKDDKKEEKVTQFGRLNAKSKLEMSSNTIMEENIVLQLKSSSGQRAFS